MALPTFLVAEMRLAFKNCVQQRKSSSLLYSRYFSNAAIRRKGPPQKKPAPQRKPASRSSDGALTARKASQYVDTKHERGAADKEETGLATQEPEKTAVGTERRVPVPLKVIPRAQLSPQVTLTPRQRLHVEMMTRRPTVSTEKKIFKERIQIYHIGEFKENILAILKVSSIVAACAVTFVIAPAHFHAGTAPWITALIWLGGFVPGLTTQYMTKSWVNRVFLDLPEKARESPKAAMEYAKNLPSDAEVDIRYLKLWGLEGSVKASTSDLVPTKGKLLQPLTFTWKDKDVKQLKATKWAPNSFFVQSTTATGNKSVNTVPGIWESVYRQIVKEPNKPSPKWQSNLEPYET